MAKQQILLVDADSSSARWLEVSLRGAGFTVAVAPSAESALEKLEHGVPDLILTDTRLPGADGFAFVRRLRARAELAEVPVVFLTEQGALDEKLRGLELGVDDYLAKPIMVREVVTRVQLLLARKKQHRIATEPQARTRFSGSLEDVAVVDLLQTIAVSGKSGVASVRHGEREALLYFERGQVIDAEVGDLTGEEAVYRTITWTTGVFDLEFRAIERPRVIDVPQPVLLMEGLRRVDELGRLAEQLPPEDAVVDIDHEALASRLNEIPDELNGILRLIDGKRTLVDLIDASPFDDLSTLTVLSKFYFEGLLLSHNPEPVEWAPGSRPGAALNREAAPSGAGPEAAATASPPMRSDEAAQRENATPAELPRESQRLTASPVATRAAADQDGKLTPKGIVNVGDTPSSSKWVPSPFRADNDAPRRSSIPMPVGSAPRNGSSSLASSHGSDGGQHTNGLRTSRTAHGLSAAFVRDPTAPAPTPRSPTSATSPVPAPPPWRPIDDAEASGETSEPGGIDGTRVAAAISATEHSPFDAPTRRAPPPASPLPAASPSATASGIESPAGSAPGSNPESEQEFFEAGDEGTYAGGPRSDVPVPVRHFDRESQEPPPPRERVTPFHGAHARRTMLVSGVLALAAASLLVAAWRHFAAERHASVSSEPSLAAAPAHFAPEAVKQTGNTGDSVASNLPTVASAGAASTVAADAAPPVVSDGSAPLASAAAPTSVAPLAPPVVPTHRAPERPASTASRPTPRAVAVPAAPTPTQPSVKSPSPAPANPAETPFIPPFAAPAPKAESRPGEKPPTKAFPLD
jgi:DNA-binding response OmpR family regulator